MYKEKELTDTDNSGVILGQRKEGTGGRRYSGGDGREEGVRLQSCQQTNIKSQILNLQFLTMFFVFVYYTLHLFKEFSHMFSLQ